MSDYYLGEIRLFGFNFAPRGWALCNGQLMSISQNSALFALLGTTYGGDGITTFALPDLRGRVAIHQGQGPGLSSHVMGEVGGTETVTLTTNQMPSHAHNPLGSAGAQTTNRPDGAAPAQGGNYSTPDASHPMATTSVVGGSQPHNNVQPYLTMNYCIAVTGIFPSRN